MWWGRLVSAEGGFTPEHEDSPSASVLPACPALATQVRQAPENTLCQSQLRGKGLYKTCRNSVSKNTKDSPYDLVAVRLISMAAWLCLSRHSARMCCNDQLCEEPMANMQSGFPCSSPSCCCSRRRPFLVQIHCDLAWAFIADATMWCWRHPRLLALWAPRTSRAAALVATAVPGLSLT